MNAHELHEFFDALAFPNEKDTAALIALGIGPDAIDHAPWGRDPLKVGYVMPISKNRFEIVETNAGGARRCVIALCYGEAGDLVDLLAVDLSSKWTALMLGNAPIIGFDALHGPNLGEPLLCHRNGASWLASGRRGFVVTDPIRARETLMIFIGPNRPMTVSDREFAKRLRDALTWSPSIITNEKAFETERRAA